MSELRTDRLEAPLAGVEGFRTAWWQRLLAEPASYEITRFVVLRGLAFVYFIAFLVLVLQGDALLGSHGLVPIDDLTAFERGHLGVSAYWRMPSLFWLGASDAVLHLAAWTGLLLSGAALLGATNALVQLALWAIYMSFVHLGQIFYGYGWEIQLLETGFLAVFLCPVRGVRPWPAAAAPKVVIWLLRWLIFRIMVGAALIKLRNDPCWRDLTCLDYHFETQPNPNPLAWYLHHAPHWVHAAGVLFNHFVELVVPWFAFGFRRVRHVAGCFLVGFQFFLISSGNLSFLNWLTIVPALACFDDSAFVAVSRLAPVAVRRAVARLAERAELLSPSRVQRRATQVLGIVVAMLSVPPVMNLLSSDQAMNTSFDPLDLVNTYGAFGSVDRERFEVILEGTRDAPTDPRARWQEYELPCTPGDIRRRPCLVTPYHYRLDWQMWFVGNGAARGEAIDDQPWLVHLVWQLLTGAPTPKTLLARDPFPRAPPSWIRAGIWRYRFSDSRADGRWWERERVGEFLPPVSRFDPRLRAYVDAYGWQ
jgi:hypothetical protein